MKYEQLQYKLMDLSFHIYNKIKRGEYEIDEMQEIYNNIERFADADFEKGE